MFSTLSIICFVLQINVSQQDDFEPYSVNDFLFDIHPDCTLEILRSFINEMNQGMVLLPKNVLHRLLVLYNPTNDGCFTQESNSGHQRKLKTILIKCNSSKLTKQVVCGNESPEVKEIERNQSTGNPLENKILRVVPSPLNAYFVKQNQSGVYDGVLFALIKELANDLKFKYNFVIPADSHYGSKYPNGSWNGLIGMLERKEADISLGAMTMTYERTAVVDFSTPFALVDCVIIIRKPENAVSIFALIWLFRPIVWLVYFTSIVAAIVMTWFLGKQVITDDCHHIHPNTESLYSTAFYIYSAQVNQHAERIFVTVSGKLFELVWRFGSFFVLATYTSGFVAYLTTQSPVLPFTNLDQLVTLANRGEYKICIAANTAFLSTVQADTVGMYKELNKFLATDNNSVTSVAACKQQLIEKPNVAYLEEMPIAQDFQNINCGKTDLVILDQKFYSSYVSLAFPKNSPYNEVISKKIREYIDSSLFDSWIEKYSSDRRFCEIFEPAQLITNTETQPLCLIEVSGAFILLAVGTVCGFSIFLIEVHFISCLKGMFRNNMYNDK